MISEGESLDAIRESLYSVAKLLLENGVILCGYEIFTAIRIEE